MASVIPALQSPPGPSPAPDVQAGQGTPPPRQPIATALLVLLVTAGLAAWAVGIARVAYDYDEVQRAHSAWLAGQGLRPYVDFFECHPPYFFLLGPIVHLANDPGTILLALRIFAAAGNLAFLAALVALGRSVVPRPSRALWPLAGVVLTALHPMVLEYLVEFRIDGWGYALAAWSLVRLRRPISPSSSGARRFLEFGALTGLASGLFCPKLVLLPPLVVFFALATQRLPLWPRAGLAAAYSLGVALAVGLFVLLVEALGIGIGPTVRLLGRYHAISNAHSAFRDGLLRRVLGTPSLSLPIALGAAVWLASLLRRPRLQAADPYLAALAVWLVSQAALVAYPYKQYYAPWFLFGSTFLTLCAATLTSLWRPLTPAVLAAALAAALADPISVGRLWHPADPAAEQRALLRTLNEIALPGDSIVAVPPYHPIARPDTFFLWFNTTDPSGYDSERILSEIPALRPLATPRRFLDELRSHPPAFIVLESNGAPAGYTSGQWQALSTYLPGRRYRNLRRGPTHIAVRPDRLPKPSSADPGRASRRPGEGPQL